MIRRLALQGVLILGLGACSGGCATTRVPVQISQPGEAPSSWHPSTLKAVAIPADAVRAPGVPTVVTRVFRSGWMEPVLRDSLLAPRWSEQPGQNERVGCVTRWVPTVQQRTQSDDRLLVIAVDTQYTVFEIQEMVPRSAGPMSASMGVAGCGIGVPVWHTHPPHSCADRRDGASCKAGGWEAEQCQPSEEDYLSLLRVRAPFSIVQCGARQHRFYYPHEYVSQITTTSLSPTGLTVPANLLRIREVPDRQPTPQRRRWLEVWR